MARYQFLARAHVANLDIAVLAKAARNHGATYVMETYPLMPNDPRPGKRRTYWRGTNQPRTVAFNARDVQTALAIAHETPDAFVWDITNGRYI